MTVTAMRRVPADARNIGYVGDSTPENPSTTDHRTPVSYVVDASKPTLDNRRSASLLDWAGRTEGTVRFFV